MAVRPSLYIGLGGTGILAVSRAKKMFEDAFGEGNIPEQIAFLAIDFDLTMDKDPRLATKSMKDDFLIIESNNDPAKLYMEQSKNGLFSWLFKNNDRFIPSKIIDGARQVRTTGRLLTNIISHEVRNNIQSRMDRIQNIQNPTQLAANTGGIVDVHIAMSLAGGTGAGSFLEVASLIRDLYPNIVRIVGYGVLHKVFRSMDLNGTQTPRVVANAYSAILDLDYLMHASINNPVQLDMNGIVKELKQPLYDEFYVIDNTTTNNQVVNHVNKLSEVIGTCLFVASGEIGTKVASGVCNTPWKDGNFDIDPKHGWVYSLGACQVVYNGKLLANIYELKAALEIIRRFRNTDSELQQKAQDWTERPNVQIREDGSEYNQLIDTLYTKKQFASLKLPNLDVKDTLTEVKAAAVKYLNSVPDFTEESKEICKRVVEDLNSFVKRLLNAENGIGSALGTLKALEAILKKYKAEMEQEQITHNNAISGVNNNGIEAGYNKSIKDYSDYLTKTFKTRKGKEEHLDSISRYAYALLKEKIEIERRKTASSIFTNILNEIDELYDSVDKINRKMFDLERLYMQELADRQNSADTELVFEIDLSLKERDKVPFSTDDVNITDFLNFIDNDLHSISLDQELDEKIRSFVSNLQRADYYRDLLIVDIIDEMKNNRPTEYDNLKEEIKNKSCCLLKINNRGLIDRTQEGMKSPSDKMINNIMIASYQKTDDNGNILQSAFKTDKSFFGNRNKEDIRMESDAFKQKIIFYRSGIAVIPFCIDAFDERSLTEYNSLITADRLFNPHFDKHVFDEMRKKDFKLKPEMQNEAMFFWICGHFFGWEEITEKAYVMEKDINGNPLKISEKDDVKHKKFIRVDKGKYEYWNEDGADVGSKRKWYTLDNTSRRDTAFNYFKTVLPKIRTTLVKKIKDDYGFNRSSYQYLIEELIKDGKFDYINRVICSDKSSITYYSSQSGEAKMLDAEFEYICTRMLNDLNNLH